MNKIWKEIPGYEEYYLISNFGEVYSKISGKILKTFKNNNGYLMLSLKGKKYLVHRLVGITFIFNPNNYSQINHRDGNKENNSADNLEWCSPSYNLKEAYRLGLNYNSEKKRKACSKNGVIASKSCRKEINQFDMQGNFIKRWGSIMEASRKLKIDSSCISKCCRGKRKSIGGYTWRFV